MSHVGIVSRRALRLALVVAAVGVLLAPVASAAGAAGSKGPQAAAFVRYQSRLMAGLTGGGAGHGLRPAPLDLSRFDGARTTATVAAYPSSYDLRTLGRVTPARNQGPNGTCWTFATMGSLESSLLPAESWDFSEDNCALTAGFDTPYGPYDTGGNYLMSTAYLARWGGPVTESDDPYGDLLTPTGLTPRKHVQEVLWLPGRVAALDNDTIKATLMDSGAVFASMHVGSSDQTTYFEPIRASWYYPGSSGPDHAVLIVGWDDAYPRSSFAVTPPGDGAFIVKNSWGGSWGDQGFFYVSYYDTQFGGDLACFSGPEPTDNYARAYQYDPLGAVISFGWDDGSDWCANVFTAQGDEQLAAVSFYTLAPGTQYEVYTGASLSQRSLRASGSFTDMGYHTVRLSPPMQLTAGQPFAVIVKLSGTTGHPIALEVPENGYSSAATATAGQSWVSSNGTSWSDLVSDQRVTNGNVCVKAFTTAQTAPPVTTPDAMPPTVTIGGAADGGFYRTARTVTVTAVDDAGGSGVASVSYAIDGQALQTVSGATASVPIAPVPNGTHVLTCFGTDVAGNRCSDATLRVVMDTAGPLGQGRDVSGRRSTLVPLRYRFTDGLSPKVWDVKVRVRDRAGRTVKLFSLGRLTPKTVGMSYAVKWRPRARGRFSYVVTCKDSAGNAQGRKAAGRIVVR